ncbi:MAG TPA: hypothetical protein VMV98_08110 [Acidobacteriaceae bacterium]|nr:hypothetical protein [Acidobacteriaceae bacterium]
MTDSEFNVWFAATGYEWRGWPEWDDREFRMRLVPHGNESQVEWFIPPDMGRRNTAYRPTHEAACIIRDFLRKELAKGVSTIQFEMGTLECLVLQYLVEHRHEMIGPGTDENAALVAAVEAARVYPELDH